MSNTLTTIATFATAAEASPARSILEENGIRAYVQGATTADTLWHVGSALSGVQLQVASNDAAKALECLGWAADDANSRALTAWTCGTCGERVDAGYEVCWNCGASFDDPPKPQADAETPAADEPTIACPMCGESLPEATIECRHCGERLDGSSYDDPTKQDADGEESEELVQTRAALTRAYRSAFLGIVFCPPLMTMYAVLQLMEYHRLRKDFDLPVEWRARAALVGIAIGMVGPIAAIYGIITR